jgi:anti-sigma B factor antagonist
MPGTPFSASLHEHQGDTVLALHGDINGAAEEGFEETKRDAANMNGRLLLDFSDVDYINSTGIALIVGILAETRMRGREVAAYGLSDHYREIFMITRLSDFMNIYEDEGAALAAQ